MTDPYDGLTFPLTATEHAHDLMTHRKAYGCLIFDAKQRLFGSVQHSTRELAARLAGHVAYLVNKDAEENGYCDPNPEFTERELAQIERAEARLKEGA